MPLATKSTQPVRAFPILFKIRHYDAAETVTWHVQLQFTRLSDPTFASRLTDLDEDTTVSQTHWFSRDDQTNATDGTWVAWPSGGVSTLRSKRADAAAYTTATAMFRMTVAANLRQVEFGEPLLVRARQSTDQGSTWDDWFSWVKQAGP